MKPVLVVETTEDSVTFEYPNHQGIIVRTVVKVGTTFTVEGQKKKPQR